MAGINLAPDTQMFVDAAALRATDRARGDTMAALASAMSGR
jgi:hypothetical protein